MSPHTMSENESPALAQHYMLRERTENPAVRRVRFANRTKVYLVPALADMTDDEYDATWTTDDESRTIQAGIIDTIKAMKKGTKDANTCSRGLEHMRSAAHLEQRKINKESVLQAVLDEQDRQWSANKAGHEEIANVASHHSKWARELAKALGESDAASARRVHSEDGCLSVLQMALDVSNGHASGATMPNQFRRKRSKSVQREPAAQREQVPRAKSVDAALGRISSRFQGEAKQEPKVGAASNAGATSNLRTIMAQR